MPNSKYIRYKKYSGCVTPKCSCQFWKLDSTVYISFILQSCSEGLLLPASCWERQRLWEQGRLLPKTCCLETVILERILAVWTTFPLLKMCWHAVVHLNSSFLEEKEYAGLVRFTQDKVQVRTWEVQFRTDEEFVVLYHKELNIFVVSHHVSQLWVLGLRCSPSVKAVYSVHAFIFVIFSE